MQAAGAPAAVGGTFLPAGAAYGTFATPSASAEAAAQDWAVRQ